MTKYTDEDDNYFNSFISKSVQDLKKENSCYVYTMEQVGIIKDIILKKLKKEISVKENECGYTLNILKKKGDIL